MEDDDLKNLNDINVTYDLMGSGSDRSSPSGQSQKPRAKVHWDPTAASTRSLIEGLKIGKPFSVGRGNEVVEFIPVQNQSQTEQQSKQGQQKQRT